MTVWVFSWLDMPTSMTHCHQEQDCSLAVPWVRNQSLHPMKQEQQLNGGDKGLNYELERSDRIRGHQPSQSMSSLLYGHFQQRLNGSDGKRQSPFSPTCLPSPPFIPPEGKYRYPSTLSFYYNKVLITPMGGKTESIKSDSLSTQQCQRNASLRWVIFLFTS